MPFAELRTGIKMYYEIQGRGEDMLLIPGTGGSRGVWMHQLDALTPLFRCITLDLRGGGKSDKPLGQYTPKMLAEDVLALMDTLGLEKPHVAGFSLGSAIGQELTVAHPERVKSLSMHNTWAKTDRWMKIRFETSKFLLLNAPKDLYDQFRRWTLYSPEAIENGLADQLDGHGSSSKSDDKEAKARLYDADIAHDVADRLRMIDIPTLVTGGEQDNSVPLRYVQQVHQLIPRSKCHLFTGDGSSHHVCVERYQEFNAVQLEFLKGITR